MLAGYRPPASVSEFDNQELRATFHNSGSEVQRNTEGDALQVYLLNLNVTGFLVTPEDSVKKRKKGGNEGLNCAAIFCISDSVNSWRLDLE